MILRKLQPQFKIHYRNVSALYLTGDKAKESFAVLVPHFDFNSRLNTNNKTKLEDNIKKRQLNYNLISLYEKYHLYRDLEKRKENLELQRIEIANKMKNSLDKDENLIRKLKIDGRIVRDDLKLLKENSYELEDNFIQQYLHLPNNLDEKTPSHEDKIIFEYLNKTDIEKPKFHLDNENLIEFYDETCFYLKNSAALLNTKIPFHCIDHFIANDNFINFSNPDFIRSIIAEAAGNEPKDLLLIPEDEVQNKSKINLLHLVGGGSYLSFFGFITKLSIFPSTLPIKLISDGNEYINPHDKSMGLYSAYQSTTVQSFIATETEDEANNEFDKTLNNLINYYKKFNLHFNVTYLSANKLSYAESMHASIQMYSPYFKKYIEIGNLCKYNDFISKRLLFNVRDGRNYKFPHIITGSFINLPKLLGIMLETNNNELKIPENFFM